ncbi:MAG TPA: SLC13 family permease, partial [Pseudomonas sp.]|nr:SLC13 family permease [Pseudomonas sp.]
RWLGSDKHGPAVEPRHTLADLARDYRLDERERRLRVLPGSILANQALDALRLRSEYGINVIAVERHERLRNLLLMATGNTELFVGDVLLVDLASPAIGLLGAYRELGL